MAVWKMDNIEIGIDGLKERAAEFTQQGCRLVHVG